MYHRNCWIIESEKVTKLWNSNKKIRQIFLKKNNIFVVSSLFCRILKIVVEFFCRHFTGTKVTTKYFCKLYMRHWLSSSWLKQNQFLLNSHSILIQWCVLISDISKTIRRHKGSSSDLDSMDESDTESQTSGSKRHKKNIVLPPRRPSLLVQPGRHHYGSFYLRMGAVGENL